MYDIAIIGSGPAGATLARLIGKDFRVLLIDRRQLTAPAVDSLVFQKCCGGLIAPDAQEMLARFGLGIPKQLLVGEQLFTVRTIDFDNSIERYYQRHYLNINREKFDRWLVSLIPTTVTFRMGCIFKGFQEDEGRIKISFSGKDGRTYSESAKILVVADGAFSQVRKQLGQYGINLKLYIAIQEQFESDQILPYYSAIFDQSITDFYAWTIPKDDCLLLGAALPLYQNPTARFELLKSKMSNYGYQLRKSLKKNGAFLLRPQWSNKTDTGLDKVILLGEAAGWISPSSAEGFSYAFKSALALAESFKANPDRPMETYTKKLRSLKQNILFKNLKSPFMYNPLLRKLAMLSGIQSMKIIN